MEQLSRDLETYFVLTRPRGESLSIRTKLNLVSENRLIVKLIRQVFVCSRSTNRNHFTEFKCDTFCTVSPIVALDNVSNSKTLEYFL